MTIADVSEASSVQPDPSPSRRRALVQRLLAPLLLVLVPCVLVALHVSSYTTVGPIDELQHIDYLYKAPEVVRPGDKVGPEAMEAEACRGIDAAVPLPACVPGGSYRPGDFQEKGYNTAAVNTPVYYTVTKVVASAVTFVLPQVNLVTAGRLVGALWLAGGLLLTYAAGRRLGVARWPLTAVLLAVSAVPSVVYTASTITPDAAAITVGGAALLAAVWWEERPARRWPVLALVTALGLAVKQTNVMIFVALGIYVLLRLLDLWSGSRRSTERGLSGTVEAPARGLVLGGAAILGAFVVVQAAWTLLQGALRHGDPNDVPMQAGFTVDRLDPFSLSSALGAFIDPLSSAIVSVGNPGLLGPVQRLVGYVLVAGLVAAALFGDRLGRVRTLAQAALLTGLVGGPAFVLVSYVTQSVYFDPPSRYATTLVPVMALAVAWLLRTRPATWVVTATSGTAVVLTLTRLLSI